ncbi:MAG: exodeoxyribonuclease VII large subunit [Proteobacteria bacterium]|nr:exodeoxyribonuclease VII large subunit [Pseudomonadota bacterium]
MGFDFTITDDQSKIYTVSKLNREVRSLLENEYDSVLVEAEVSDVTRARSGHIYFTLTDPGGKAYLSAVMWQGLARRYGSRLQTGAKIRCHGRVTLYEARGSYQLVVDRVEDAGAGEKARILAELKAKLESEGLFDPERKRPLPLFPECIGVVTSRDGAAIKDIIKVIFRRFPVRILLAHAQVQGESAPREIVAALNLLATRNDVDAVILGRGGGSSEDLDAFNSEEVVRAVCRHPKPVVSAIGHEIDITLVDLVSDKRAATPSEAAEITVPDGHALLERLALTRGTLKKAIQRHVSIERERITVQDRRLKACDPRVDLRRKTEALATAREILARWPELTLARARANLAMAEKPLSIWPKPALEHARGELSKLVATLEALSPLSALSRGYSIVRRVPDQKIVYSADDAPPGTEVDVTLSRGSLVCDVKKATIPSSD